MTAVTDITRPAAFAESPASGLVCRECRTAVPLAPVHVCLECFAPLEVAYDEDRLRAVTRASIAAGPQTIWRYAGLLPAGQDLATRVDIGAGMTTLRSAPNLAKALGMRRLWVKDDSGNPTHSFKDRVVSVALSAARAFGYTTVSCASTGNLANSVAAHAAATGLRSVVFIPDDLEQGKVVQTAVYGQTLVAVQGSYDDVNRLC
ncbi:MAG: pyridoxal-phosphate dependent enzyme, partial [Rhodoferax sp.]|nr:pyridoxal-phosphate dependent enzyme [Actinomycetota bacterium]